MLNLVIKKNLLLKSLIRFKHKINQNLFQLVKRNFEFATLTKNIKVIKESYVSFNNKPMEMLATMFS